MQKFLLYPKKKAIILPRSFEPPAVVVFKEVEYRGKVVRVVRDDLKNYYALKPSLPDLECPIYRHYDWPLYKYAYKPMSHQKATAGFIVDKPKNLVLSSTGTGKTFSILLAFKYLKDCGLIDKMVVVCPISVMQVWEQEIFGSFLDTKSVVLYGAAQKRKELMRTVSDVYITNFDGIKVLEPEMLSFVDDKTYLVVDEASKCNNANTKMYEVMEKLVKKSSYVTLSTATPTARCPTQGWALSRLTNPETPRFFGKYRDMVQYKVTQFLWQNRANANEVVNKYLQPSILFHKNECLDLPELTVRYLEVPLSKEQDRVYKKVKKELASTLASGEEITATNAAHAITVLRQTALGVVKIGEDQYEPIDKDAEGNQKVNDRLQTLIDLVEAEERKIIIVVPFKGAILHYYSVLSKMFDCAYVNGDVCKNERNKIFDDFQNSNRIKCLLVHEQVASHGVNLHLRCSHIVFAGPIFSSDAAIQLRGRIERANQKYAMTITRLYGTTLEKQIYEKLDKSDYTQRELLDMYKQEVETA